LVELHQRILRTGIFFCKCRGSLDKVLDIKKLEEYARGLPTVILTGAFDDLCSAKVSENIKDEIRKNFLNRIIFCGCSARIYETRFKETFGKIGIHKHFLHVINIREHCAWCHRDDPKKAMFKAKKLIKSGLRYTMFLERIPTGLIDMNQSVLIIGAGPAGIAAAKTLADQDLKVYLVEKAPVIGGKPMRWSRDFPTNECSICSSLFDISQIVIHPNIEIISYAEIENVCGRQGDYKVTIVEKPRYVSKEKCTNCGSCSLICPVEMNNEYNFNLSKRKAIFIPFVQAHPAVRLIDESVLPYCLNTCNRKCILVCPTDAINFEDKPKRRKLVVGAIICAIGYDLYSPNENDFGFGVLKNVLTAPQMERLFSTGGPTKGKIIRPSDGKLPKKIGFILCVGSRNESTPYCSRYCCMTTLKSIKYIKEQIPSSEIYVFYKDMVIYGLEAEMYYKITKNMEGVHFIRAIPNHWDTGPNDVIKLINGSDVYEIDLLILATGVKPSESHKQIGEILGIQINEFGFFNPMNALKKVQKTFDPGKFICGGCTGPKILSESYIDGLAAASEAAILLSSKMKDVELLSAKITPEKCSGCRSCINTCHFNAIQIVDGKARVDELLCRNCGNCAVSCPSDAISITLFSSQQILSQIEALSEQMPKDEVSVIVFACHHCGYGAADIAGNMNLDYPPNSIIIRVPCLGRVDITFIISAFQGGFSGVVLAGCYKNRCHNIIGNESAGKRLKMLLKILATLGIRKERIKIIEVAPSQGKKFVQEITEFISTLEKLGVIPFRKEKIKVF
jgi:heterodisulfide reductase subunit A